LAEVGALRISVGLNTAEVTNGIKSLNQRLNALNSEFRAVSAGSSGFDNSLQTLKSRADVLNRTLQVHRAKVEELRRKYEQSKATKGEDADETIRAAAAYNRALTAMRNTERQLDQINDQINEQTNRWRQLSNRLNDTGASLQDMGDKFKNAGQGLTAGVTVPLMGFATMAGKAAFSFDTAAGTIQAEIGETGASAKKLQKIAEGLWKKGFGEDLQSVAVKVAGVSKALGDLSEVDFTNVTKGLDLFEKRGWADQQETLRAVKVLMEQFGMSASQAMDYLTKGFQENLNYSGEFLDSVSEYSTYFAEFGLSANDMFAKFKAGAETGAFQLDKIGDAMKEFSLRAKDGSKTSAEAFKALGLNANEMTKKFNVGGETAKKAFETVVTALLNTKDETIRNTAAVGLFGTQYEDLGEKAFEAMLKANKGFENVEGATKKASKALHDNFGTKVQKLWRGFQKDLEPVGEDLLKIGEEYLPKVANTLDKVTSSFSEMSPEGQKAAIMIAGIAAAAGPATMAIGGITSGIGFLNKGLAHVISLLGGSGGFAASLGAIAGPAALVAVGIGTVKGLVVSVKNDFKKAKEVNLEHAESLIKQQQALEGLTTRFQELSDKNKLSNDELMRFRDIQSELKFAKSAEEIAKLKDEQAKLQEKSGLTNEELSEMISLNDEIIKKAPEVDRVYSDRGNAIITNKDALNEVNGKLRENIQLELENQRIKAEAKLDQHIRDYITALDELKAKEAERDEAVKVRNELEQELTRLRIEAQNQLNAGKEAEAEKTIEEIANTEILLNQQNQKVLNLAGEVEEKQKSVEKSQEEIEKTQELYEQMINLQLAQAGINAKGAEGIAQLDDAIAKTQKRIEELYAAKEAQGGLNSEQQEELSNLQQALGKYQSTKSEIQKIQGEQQTVNTKIQEGTNKAQNMNTELGKNVNKNVTVDDKGKADELNEKVGKAITKKVTLKAIWSGVTAAMKAALPFFAKGTKYAPGGPSVVGEAGRELTYFPNRGLALVNGPTLLNLPRGAKVIPNRDTERILRSWNIPKLASGGITISEGWAIAGERGREIVDLRGASVSNQTTSPLPKQPVLLQLLMPNERVMAEWLVDDITALQEFKANRIKVFG
jgi:phage-related minor tail protein